MIRYPATKHRILLLELLMLLAVLGVTSALAAPPNDTFATRSILTGGSGTGASGSTDGAGSQGEVDEKMEPASASQASVWYEWTVPPTNSSIGPWQIIAQFNTGSVCSMATYILPPGATAMSQLEPAGACLTPVDGGVSVNLYVQTGQRVVFRVWTPNTAPSSRRSFSLGWEALFPLQFPGDQAIRPSFMNVGVSPGTYTSTLAVQFRNYFTEVDDARLEDGHWAPATATAWARWIVPPGPANVWRMALMPESDTVGRVEVLRPHPTQPGRYQPLTPPGIALEFTPVPGEILYIRTSTTTPAHALHLETLSFYFHQLCTTDERSTVSPGINPDTSAWASLHGATPSAAPLPADNPYTLNMQDIWIRLDGLEPGNRYHLWRTGLSSNNIRMQLYESRSPDILRAVAEGSDLAFTTLPDRLYFARLSIHVFFVDSVSDYLTHLSLYNVTHSPPPNDEPAGAIVIQGVMTHPLTGDLLGATASPEEALVYSGDPPALTVSPAYRSVWYALDLPASPNRVGVTAWGNGVTLLKSGPGDSLTVIPPPPGIYGQLTYQPDGSRVFARVQGPADRFLFLVVPVTLTGDERHSPIPLNTGETSRYFPNWATQEADDGLPSDGFGTTWHVWTTAETGMYHLSSVGSAGSSNWDALAIYRAADGAKVVPVASPNLDNYLPGGGDVLVFEAAAGETYLFRTALLKSTSGPAVLRITPAAGASPYTFWKQSRPAWDDILADPLADPDGDGANNLWEMVMATHPGIRGYPPVSFVSLASPSPPGMQVYLHSLASTVIAGPTGCAPFVITTERSSDLISWQQFPAPEANGVQVLATDPLRYVRFRITR